MECRVRGRRASCASIFGNSPKSGFFPKCANNFRMENEIGRLWSVGFVGDALAALAALAFLVFLRNQGSFRNVQIILGLSCGE